METPSAVGLRGLVFSHHESRVGLWARGWADSTLDHTGFPALGRAVALQWRVELPQSPALSRLLDRSFSVPPGVSGLSGSPNGVVLLKSTGSSDCLAEHWIGGGGWWGDGL